MRRAQTVWIRDVGIPFCVDEFFNYHIYHCLPTYYEKKRAPHFMPYFTRKADVCEKDKGLRCYSEILTVKEVILNDYPRDNFQEIFKELERVRIPRQYKKDNLLKKWKRGLPKVYKRLHSQGETHIRVYFLGPVENLACNLTKNDLSLPNFVPEYGICKTLGELTEYAREKREKMGM